MASIIFFEKDLEKHTRHWTGVICLKKKKKNHQNNASWAVGSCMGWWTQDWGTRSPFWGPVPKQGADPTHASGSHPKMKQSSMLGIPVVMHTVRGRTVTCSWRWVGKHNLEWWKCSSWCFLKWKSYMINWALVSGHVNNNKRKKDCMNSCITSVVGYSFWFWRVSQSWCWWNWKKDCVMNLPI